MGNGQQQQLHEDSRRKSLEGKTRQGRAREEKGMEKGKEIEREKEFACKYLCFSPEVEDFLGKQMLSLKSCVYWNMKKEKKRKNKKRKTRRVLVDYSDFLQSICSQICQWEVDRGCEGISADIHSKVIKGSFTHEFTVLLTYFFRNPRDLGRC